MRDIDFKLLGSQTRKYRERRGYSIEYLSKETDISISRIRTIENGKATVTVNEMLKLTSALGVTPDHLCMSELTKEREVELLILDMVNHDEYVTKRKTTI